MNGQGRGGAWALRPPSPPPPAPPRPGATPAEPDSSLGPPPPAPPEFRRTAPTRHSADLTSALQRCPVPVTYNAITSPRFALVEGTGLRCVGEDARAAAASVTVPDALCPLL